MVRIKELTEVTDNFVMNLGLRALQDIDTPAFMRKRCGVSLVKTPKPINARRIVEPEKKIIDFAYEGQTTKG